MIEIAEALADHTVVSIYFLRVSLVLGGVYLLASTWKNASASLKAGILRAGLLGLYLLPLLYFYTPNWDVDSPISSPETNSFVEQASDTFVSPPNALRISPASSVTSDPGTPAEVKPQHWIGDIKHIPLTSVLIFIWGLGIFILVVRWFNDERLIRKILRDGKRIRSFKAHHVLDEIVTTLKLKQRIILIESASIGSPITVGVFRPVILLPVMAEHWTSEQLKAVFLHEIAHIKRHDYLVYVCVQIVCIVYWMNPFVWLAKKRLVVEQEKACDDEVLQSGMVHLEYAEHLVTIARWANLRNKPGLWSTRHALGMAQEPMLKQRMRAILSTDTPRSPLRFWNKGAIILVALCMLLPISALKFDVGGLGSYTYVWYEAESGELSGKMNVRSHESSSGYKYVEAIGIEGIGEVSKEDALMIRFQIAEAGEYVIWGRILAPSRDENSFYVSVNGGDKVLWDTQGPDQEMTAQVWSWDPVRSRSASSEEGGNPKAFYFEPGWHTLRIFGREEGTGLDRVLITNNVIYRPRGKGDAAEVTPLDYIWIEPENGRLHEPMKQERDASASNHSFIWAGNSYSDGVGEAHMRFHVEEAGDYVIWGRVLAPTTSDNSFYIRLDNGDELLWDVYGPDKNKTAQAWWWDQVRDRETTKKAGLDSLVFALEKGWHTLALRSREAGTQIDRLLVTNDKSFIPEGWGTSPKELMPVNLWMEAEDARIRPPLGIGMDPNASNGAYIEVTGQHQSTSQPPEDGHASFYVDVPVSGTYLLWGRVDAPAQGDSFWLRIDGQRWIRWNGIQNGSGWHWEEVHDNVYNNRVLSLELVAGSHLIELAYREKNTRLDGLLLTNDLNYVPASTLHESVVQKREVLVSAFRN